MSIGRANYSTPVASLREWLHESRSYRLQTRWCVPGNVESVAEILQNTDDLPLWWSQFIESECLEAGEPSTQGRWVRVVTKGWLPYKLRFCFRIEQVRFPHYFHLIAQGDFEGIGCGRLQQDRRDVIVDFDWNIRVTKPLLYRTSMFLKPVFIHNHRWLMAQGQQSLRRRLTPPAA